MSTEYSSRSILLFVAALLVGALVAWKAQPYIAGNSEAVNIIVTTFSVLAGFLVAIMTIIASPSSPAGRSWRYYELWRRVVKVKLSRHKFLFVAYLITLGLIFAASLIPESYPRCIEILQRIYLFVGTVAFVMSLLLPGALMRIQLEHHDDLVAHHRKKAGIADDD